MWKRFAYYLLRVSSLLLSPLFFFCRVVVRSNLVEENWKERYITFSNNNSLHTVKKFNQHLVFLLCFYDVISTINQQKYWKFCGFGISFHFWFLMPCSLMLLMEDRNCYLLFLHIIDATLHNDAISARQREMEYDARWVL